MTKIGTLAGGVWTFVRSDPAQVRQLNTPGNWSTWQAGRQQPPRREVAPGPHLAAPERRSLRRRRSLAA